MASPNALHRLNPTALWRRSPRMTVLVIRQRSQYWVMVPGVIFASSLVSVERVTAIGTGPACQGD